MSNVSVIERIDTMLNDEQRARSETERLLEELPATLGDSVRLDKEAPPEASGQLSEAAPADGAEEGQEQEQASTSWWGRQDWLLAGGMLLAALVGVIGFAGSYSEIHKLALAHGFAPEIAAWVPVGVDAGIVAFLALDLALTRRNAPMPMLRRVAWVLTIATVWFNSAAHWGDPVAVGMHASLPLLFIGGVEAMRHFMARQAGIEAGTHIDDVRAVRWLLAPGSTWRIWRRMRMWELTSYREVIAAEREVIAYRALLRQRYGSVRKAPEALRLRLRLARTGAPLHAPLPDVDRLMSGPGVPASTGSGSRSRRAASTGSPAGAATATGSVSTGGTGAAPGATGSGKGGRSRRTRKTGNAPDPGVREEVREEVRRQLRAGSAPSPTDLAGRYDIRSADPVEWARNQIRAVRSELAPVEA